MPDKLPTITGDGGYGHEAGPVVIFDVEGNPIDLGQTNAIRSAVAVPVNTDVQPGSLFAITCTVAGNVAVVLADDSASFIVVAEIGQSFLPFAVKRVNSSGTTATATYANLS